MAKEKNANTEIIKDNMRGKHAEKCMDAYADIVQAAYEMEIAFANPTTMYTPAMKKIRQAVQDAVDVGALNGINYKSGTKHI